MRNHQEDEADAHSRPTLGEDGTPEEGSFEVDDDFGKNPFDDDPLTDGGDEEEEEGGPFPPAEDDDDDG